MSAATVLRAVARLKRAGHAQAMRELEEREPDLAEYVFESLSTIHERLARLGGDWKRTRRTYHDLERLVLTLVSATAAARQHLLDGLLHEPGATADQDGHDQ